MFSCEFCKIFKNTFLKNSSRRLPLYIDAYHKLIEQLWGLVAEVFYQKNVFENVLIFTEKHLCWSLFNKVAGLQCRSFIKKRLQHSCFPVNIAKFLRAPVLKIIFKRLLLFMFLGVTNPGGHALTTMSMYNEIWKLTS